MKFWKTLVGDWAWWAVMAVLFFVQLIIGRAIGLIPDPVIFFFGYWVPCPLWYYLIVYPRTRTKA